jgi:metal-responsive CopG/Arc/MetJ family transcriptional regulator
VKEFKLQLDNSLWERFYRAFPGHGERTTIIRKVIRNLVILKAEEEPIDQTVAGLVWEEISLRQSLDDEEEV